MIIIWNEYEMIWNLNLHLKWDVLMLADAFEKFRNNSLNNYELCPGHYLSAPALNWEIMLNMKKAELEIIADPVRCERWSFLISNRYSKANNMYLKSYDPKSESKPLRCLSLFQ